MLHSVRRFDIVGACLLVMLLTGMGLAAQSVGENYECSMECHEIAQEVYEHLGGGSSATDVAYEAYMSCVFSSCG